MTHDTMDIRSVPDTKIIYNLPNNGYQSDKEGAAKHLTLGETYTVLMTDVGPSCSHVMLKEFPDRWFNTVMFSSVKDDEAINEDMSFKYNMLGHLHMIRAATHLTDRDLALEFIEKAITQIEDHFDD